MPYGRLAGITQELRMLDHAPLTGLVVMGFALALLGGMLAQRVRLSPIVGYLAAGICIGPFTPG